MLWDDTDSANSLHTEEQSSDTDFWEEIKEIDIGISHTPTKGPGSP